MGFEPRMRGRRFGKPPAKKKTAKNNRELLEATMPYVEVVPVDPSKLRSLILNSLEHLGTQRFALPPFSEHLQRWIKDVTTLLADFESQLPSALDQQYRESIEKTTSNLQAELQHRIETETNASSKLSEMQRQLAASESELSKLDHDYKTRTREMRRSYEQSFEKIQRDINTIDRERLRILHAKPTLLQKLFRRSEVDLDEKTDTLRSKKDVLGDRKQALNQDLEKARSEYEINRRRITERLDSIRTKVNGSKEIRLDDALEIRKAACEELRRDITEVVDRLLEHADNMAKGEPSL